MAQIPFGTLFMLLYYAGNYFDILWSIPVLAALIAYCWWLLDHVRRRMLPDTLPGALKRKIRRETRNRLRTGGA
jgi:cytochrome c-type biogenesis protein CcmH/NrfF